MPMEVIEGDILEQSVDAIVIPVVPYGRATSRFTRRIYRMAGEELLQARKGFKKLTVGQSAITSGYHLNAKYVIHVRVPEWYGGTSNEPRHLTKCYCEALKLATKHRLNSVAFTLLGTGTNRFPFEIAKRIAVDTINGYLSTHRLSLQVYLVIYHHPDHADFPENISQDSSSCLRTSADCDKLYRKAFEESPLNNRVEFNEKRVQDYLIKNIANEEFVAELIEYDKSNISRLISGRIKKPNKSRAIALAIAMQLPDVERFDFIRCVGYSYPDEERDYTIEEIIRSGKRDFTAVNDALCAINPDFSLKKIWHRKK